MPPSLLLLKIFYNIASKVTKFQQPSNLLTFSAYSITLLMHADDAMTSLKCMSISLQLVLRNVALSRVRELLKRFQTSYSHVDRSSAAFILL